MVSQFKGAWDFLSNKDFSPQAPFNAKDRKLYWDSELYRVKHGTRWMKTRANYTFYTFEEIMGFIKEATQ